MKKKPPKFPSSIILMGRVFKVKQIANITHLGEKVDGLCDPETQIIYVEKALVPYVKLKTLIHECCHAMLTLTGVDQKMSAGEVEMYCQLSVMFVEDMQALIESQKA